MRAGTFLTLPGGGRVRFLPSTAVGTLEFRAIQEPIRTVKGLGEYYQAKACSINTQTQTIECEDVFKHGNFAVKYDYLVVGCGMKSNDFVRTQAICWM